MKKSLVLLLLITSIIIVSTLGTVSFAYADEIQYDTTVYYSAKEHITCFDDSALLNPVCIIPKSYFFKVTGKNETSIEILYNGTTLFLSNSDFENKTTKSSLTEITKPGYKLESIQAPENKINVYTSLSEIESDTNTYYVSNIDFIGAYLEETTSTYYFYVNLSITSLNTSGRFLIKADTVSTSFSYQNIPLNPASQEFKNQEKEHQTIVAQNKLKLNIFYFTIAAMAVLIVILVYNPFKKKGVSSTPSNHSSEDDY